MSEFEFGEVFFQEQEVGGALEAGAFAELGGQDFEDSCGREAGLGDEQQQEAFGCETGDQLLRSVLLPVPGLPVRSMRPRRAVVVWSSSWALLWQAAGKICADWLK